MLDFPSSVWKHLCFMLLFGTVLTEQSAAAPTWWERLWTEDREEPNESQVQSRVDATAVHHLSDEQGPWMIMALSFRGPTAI